MKQGGTAYACPSLMMMVNGGEFRMIHLGVLTIGETPRSDGLSQEMSEALGPGYRLVECGALDGLTDAEVATLAPDPDDYSLITLRADGSSVTVSKQKLLPRLQTRIDLLEREEGVSGTLLMCTGAFPPFDHSRPLFQPQSALYRVAQGFAAGGCPASLVPLPVQVEQMRYTWAEIGVPDAVVVVANPYAPLSGEAVARAAAMARAEGASALLMDCFGYTKEMKVRAQEAFGGPVILARSMAVRLLVEMTD